MYPLPNIDNVSIPFYCMLHYTSNDHDYSLYCCIIMAHHPLQPLAIFLLILLTHNGMAELAKISHPPS